MMKISARNILPGKVMTIEKGTTTAHVRIEVAKGVVITASITNEAADDLDLKVGDQASASSRRRACWSGSEASGASTDRSPRCRSAGLRAVVSAIIGKWQ